MPHPVDHEAFRAHLPAVRAYARRRIDATTAALAARRCLANRRRSDDRRSALAERAYAAVLPGGDEGAVRVMITRDGTVLVESADTSRATGKAGLQPMTSSITAAFRARNRQDFAAAFRAAYDNNALADRGLTTFDHRPAHRFAVVKGLDGIDALDYYADPDTGRPLGSVERIGDQTNVRRLTTWERLDPNPVTLAKLDIR